MQIGVPAEIYPGEARVAATPETVKKLVAGGRHTVIIQTGAGERAAVRDSDYEAAGASRVPIASMEAIMLPLGPCTLLSASIGSRQSSRLLKSK